MLIDGADPSAAPEPATRLIKLLIRVRRFHAALVGSDGVPFAALAKQERCEPILFYAARPPQHLAPDLKAEHDPLHQASGKREVPGFA